MSYGANVMFRHLARGTTKVDGYVGISTPFDIKKTIELMPFYYQTFFTLMYKRGINKNK